MEEDKAQLEFANRQLAALAETAKVFGATPTEDELLSVAPRQLTQSLEFDRATIWYYRDGTFSLASYHFEHDPPERIARWLEHIEQKGDRYPPHFHRAVVERRTIHVANLRDDPEWTVDDTIEPDVTSLVITPLILSSGPAGVLIGNLDIQQRAFTDADIARLETFATMLALRLDNIRNYQQLETLVSERTAALRSSEDRFQSIETNISDIICSVSPDGLITYISPNVGMYTDATPADIVGHSWADSAHPDDQGRLRRFLDSMAAPDHYESGVEARWQQQDSSWVWWGVKGAPIMNEDGTLREIIIVSRDITEYKEMIAQLASANDQVRTKQAQLVQSEKMASLGLLVAGIAHEINTPVGAIHSMHDTLVRAVGKLRKTISDSVGDDHPATAKLVKALEVIDEANRVIDSGTQRVTEIVRRLRAFARLDEAELKTVDIHEGLDDTLMLMHHELKRGVTIERDYGELQPIPVYPGRLNQVFLNVINNARQAMDNQGTITISTRLSEQQITIRIGDTGPGIAPDHLKRIFDPGFTTKGVGVGTGLGLSIVYQIIEDHRGEITVESTVGEGTTFTITLPTNLDELVPT